MHPVDHVMVVVDDLEDATQRFGVEHGLTALAGGRHDGLGTSNAIIPLGDDYIELIAVTDADEAASNPVGRFLTHRLAVEGPGLVAVCLRTAHADEVARRTKSSAVSMSRTRPDGHALHWDLIGMEGALAHGLPFFITWTLDDHHPARTPIVHPSKASRIAWVEVGGDPDRLRAWVGSDEPQLRYVDGPSGPRRFAIATPAGELVLS